MHLEKMLTPFTCVFRFLICLYYIVLLFLNDWNMQANLDLPMEILLFAILLPITMKLKTLNKKNLHALGVLILMVKEYAVFRLEQIFSFDKSV